MQEEHFWNRSKAAFIMASGTGLILTALFAKYSFGHLSSAVGLDTLGNIKVYILAVMIWFLSSVLSFFAFSKLLPEKGNKILGGAVIGVTALFFGYASFEAFKFMGSEFKITDILFFVLYAAGVVVLYHFYDKWGFQKIKGIVVIILIAVFSVLWYNSCCYQNTYNAWAAQGVVYNVYHSSAYIDSISNIYFCHPYYGLECDLYGHYGLFFLYPLRWFGANTQTIGVIMGVLAAVSYASFGLAIHLSVKQFFVKVTALITLAFSGFLAVSMYWQTFPHRLVFPSLTLLALAVCGRLKPGKKSFIAGLLLTTLAVIWNFETGLLCALAWGVFGAAAFTPKFKRIFLLMITEAVTLVVSCGGALAVLNFYNYVRKGPVLGFAELRGFANSAGFISHVSSAIDFGNVEYTHAIILLMGCLLWGFWKFLFEESSSAKILFAIGVAIFGLGIITYYVNDSGGGPTVFMSYLSMAAAVVASGIDNKKDLYALVKKGACVYACMIIFVFGMINKNFPDNAKSIEEYDCLDYEEFQSFADTVHSQIAPDTKGEGYGVSALFLAMGQDDGTDDFHLHMEDVQDSEHFLTIFAGETELEGYRLVNVFGYKDIGFGLGYYEKIHDEE